MLYEALVEELVTNALTAPIVAGSPNRVYPIVIPQKVKGGADQVPCIVYNLTAVNRSQTYCGTIGLVHSRISLDSYALSYPAAKTLADAIRRALTDFRGLLGGTVPVRTATLETEFDLNDPTPGLYRVAQTWAIWHTE